MTSAQPSPASQSAHSGPDPVCVAVSAGAVDELTRKSLDLLPSFPFQEFRLDYLPDPARAVQTLAPFLRAQPSLHVLVTCRRKVSGGKFSGSAADEVALLRFAARAGAALVDLSLESAEELGPGALDHLRAAGARVVLSFHDFERTPELDGVLARMRPFAPDSYKIVPTARQLRDSLSLLSFLREATRSTGAPVVGISMGEAGLITRVLGPRFGAPFTFAAPSPAEATAPGQLTARSLRELYRIDRIGPATRVYAVAGDPIRSSLSPLMHNTAFRTAGLDAVYVPLQTASAAELFEAVRTLGLAGCSVTMPLKQDVMPFLDELDPLAARIGAVNTLESLGNGRFRGLNTDADGIVVPLQQRLTLRGARVLVLGAGGAARAAVFGCMDQGAQVAIHNRTPEKAEALAREAGAVSIPRSALRRERFDVLIHTTPAGMRGNPLQLPLDEDELRAELVFDTVYNPLRTPLLELARAQGLATIDGTEMFVHQGARQFERWTGQPAPVDEMRAAVLQALAGNSGPANPPSA